MHLIHHERMLESSLFHDSNSFKFNQGLNNT